jgi:hypothetical protein
MNTKDFSVQIRWISAFTDSTAFCGVVTITLADQKCPGHSLAEGEAEEVGGASQWQIIADYMAACQNTTSSREEWKSLTHPVNLCMFI